MLHKTLKEMTEVDKLIYDKLNLVDDYDDEGELEGYHVTIDGLSGSGYAVYTEDMQGNEFLTVNGFLGGDFDIPNGTKADYYAHLYRVYGGVLREFLDIKE